jgi:voltage-gated potassium channel
MYALIRFIEKSLYDVTTKQFMFVNNLYAAVTLASVLSLILSTVPALIQYEHVFYLIEYGTVALFTLEYLGRIIANRRNIRSYIFSFFGIVDLLAIVPTFASFTNLTFLKTARILRILLFLRMIRVVKVLRASTSRLQDPEELAHHFYRINIRIYFFALLSTIVIFSSLIYAVENDINPIFANIPLAMIWTSKVILGGVAQHMPQTVWGDIITIATRFTGLALFGLLISIIGNSLRKILFGTENVTEDNLIRHKIRPSTHKTTRL